MRGACSTAAGSQFSLLLPGTRCAGRKPSPYARGQSGGGGLGVGGVGAAYDGTNGIATQSVGSQLAGTVSRWDTSSGRLHTASVDSTPNLPGRPSHLASPAGVWNWRGVAAPHVRPCEGGRGGGRCTSPRLGAGRTFRMRCGRMGGALGDVMVLDGTL